VTFDFVSVSDARGGRIIMHRGAEARGALIAAKAASASAGQKKSPA